MDDFKLSKSEAIIIAEIIGIGVPNQDKDVVENLE